MFERIINFFKKGGAQVGMIDEFNSITDHPKIATSQEDLSRIKENIQLYKSEFSQITYLNSNGKEVEREFHALNLSQILSRKMSKLVFNEGVEININDDNKADEFIRGVFKNSKFRKNFGEELEAGYAIGGLVLRPYFDTGSKTIKISYAKADSFFTLQSNTNDISDMAFRTVTSQTEGKKKVYYTLLEFHEWRGAQYVISNELYRSERPEKLGYKVSLATLDKYKDLQPQAVLTGFSRPLFVYIKLAGKNNKNLYSPLSLGVIDNSKRQLKDINEKYDEFMWEIEEARRKIIASDHFFKVKYDSNGVPIKQFDSKTSVYHAIRSDEPSINEFVPSLRAEEFIQSINFILRIIEMQTGFSSGTLSFDGQSVKTATEIISENSETYSTRSDNVLLVEEGLKELIISIFELANAYGLYKKPPELNITVDFDDGVFQSQDSKLDYYSRATTMQLMPRYEAIARMFKVSEQTAVDWVKAMNAEAMGMDPMEQQTQNETDIFGPGE